MSNEKSRSELKKVEIGSKATSIEKKCFSTCYNVNEISIPANVTIINKDAFKGAKELTKVVFEDRSASEINTLVSNIADIGLTKLNIAEDKDGTKVNPSRTMKIVYESGDEVEQGIPTSGLIRRDLVSLNHREIESLDLGVTTEIEDGTFLDCDKLVELVLDECEAEDVAEKVVAWDLGINCEGTTHLVVVYCKDGVVVINDADSSSGEMGLRIDWDKFATMLEDYPNMSALPAVRTSLIVPYKVDMDSDPVDTEWEIIGYNTSIPEYVKYKNGTDRIYVSSLKSGLLAAITSGDSVYIKTESGEYTTNSKTVASVGSGTFIYGNNCTYDVPKSITVDGTEYTFAGYNCTLMSKYGLGIKDSGTLYHYPQFDSGRGQSNYGQNDWSTSMLRSWMNGTGDTSRLANQTWTTLTFSGSKTISSAADKKLTNRLTDTKFIKNVMKTVNRTWTFKNSSYDWTVGKIVDGNRCEHVVDKFWLMGIGNVNCSGSSTNSYFKDQNYDTNKYSDIFNNTDIWTLESSHIRRSMKEDGSEGTPCRWWLHSAGSNSSNYGGYVHSCGDVNSSYAYCSFGVLPACTIG